MLSSALWRITVVATLIAVPAGLMAGIYLAEFSGDSKVGDYSRFSGNVLMGMPSIIVGYLCLYPGGGAPGKLLRLCRGPGPGHPDAAGDRPHHRRYAAAGAQYLAGIGPGFGAPRWKVTLAVVFRAAKSGLITGILLAVARVSGETAPLLFTALNSPYWVSSLNQPHPQPHRHHFQLRHVPLCRLATEGLGGLAADYRSASSS